MNNSQQVNTEDVVRIQVPARPAYVGVVRLALAAVASRCGFDVEALEDIKVAVAEAVTNVILHCRECRQVQIEAEPCMESGCFVVRVSDTGRGFCEEELEKPNLQNPSEEGGLGIFIIRSLMDEVEFYSRPGNGTVVVMKKRLQFHPPVELEDLS